MALMDNAAELLTGGVGWSEQDARARGVEIRRIEEARNQELEEHKASVLTAVSGAW